MHVRNFRERASVHLTIFTSNSCRLDFCSSPLPNAGWTGNGTAHPLGLQPSRQWRFRRFSRALNAAAGPITVSHILQAGCTLNSASQPCGVQMGLLSRMSWSEQYQSMKWTGKIPPLVQQASILGCLKMAFRWIAAFSSLYQQWSI